MKTDGAMTINLQAAIEYLDKRFLLRLNNEAYESAGVVADVLAALQAAIQPQHPDHDTHDEAAAIPDISGPYTAVSVGTHNDGHRELRNTWEVRCGGEVVYRRNGDRAERRCKRFVAQLNQAYKNGQMAAANPNDAEIVKAGEAWFDQFGTDQTTGMAGLRDASFDASELPSRWARLNLENEAMTKDIELLRAKVAAMEPVVKTAVSMERWLSRESELAKVCRDYLDKTGTGGAA